MKRIMALFAVLVVATIALAGCGGNDDTMVISERFFAEEMQDLVINHRQYLDRDIQFEGLFRHMEPADGRDRFMVMRYRLGCCDIEIIGLQVLLDGAEPFEEEAWVEVGGTLILENGVLALRVTSITELEERGNWFLT